MGFGTAIDLLVAASPERAFALAKSSKQALLNFGARLGLDGLRADMTRMDLLRAVETHLENMTPRDEQRFVKAFGEPPSGGA